MRPPLVLLHGMWSSPAAFARLRPVLEGEGWETHAPALPFHDRDPSLPPPEGLGRITIEDYVQHLAGIIARLGRPPVLIGHSMGGMLAQVLAARLPHAGLALLATAATDSTRSLGLDPLRTLWGVVSHWGWWEAPVRIGADAARWGIYNGVPDEVASAEIARLTWDSGRVLAEMIRPALSATTATRIDLARLTRPALLIVGREDRILPPAISLKTARLLGGAVDYEELRGAGHWLFHGEAERRMTARLLGWLGHQEPA